MTSNHLFQLIRSLDAREKRYFRLKQGLYNKQNGSLYSRLYDLMEAQEVYDEAQLQEQISAGRPGRQFHVLKNHLYHQLLDALIDFRGEKDPGDRITKLIRKARILQEKKLYREAARFWQRAARLAKQLDQFEQLLLIYKHWKRLYAWVLEVDKRAEHIARFWQMEQDALGKLSNLRELEWASMRVFDLYYRMHYARNEQEKSRYDELMQHHLLRDYEQPLSFSARVVYLNTHGLYQDAIGRKEACIAFRQQLVELYQSRPDLLQESFAQYLAAFNNYLLGLVHQSRFPEATTALEKLGRLPEEMERKMSNTEKVMWFRSCFSLRLEVFIRTGDFSAAAALAAPTQQYFKELGKDMSPAFRAPFQYFFAYTEFALGRYDEALDFLAPLIRQVEWMFKQELFRFARLLQLIIHWEKGDFELLPSLLRSTRRYLRKSGGTFALEDRLFKFLSKTPHTDRRDALLRLKKDLMAGPPEIRSPQVLHHFHFLCWVESHLKKRSFAEVYREFIP